MKLREFVTTVYIIHNQHFLFVKHPKYQKWMPPGGHLEPNETPAEAARREVIEETGFEIEFIQNPTLPITATGAVQIECPCFSFLYEIPPYKNQPAHQHIDLIFLAKPVGPSGTEPEGECRWFSLEEIEKFKIGEEIFSEIVEIAKAISVLPVFLTTKEQLL